MNSNLWTRFRAHFAWREVGRSARHIYQENTVTGARRYVETGATGGYVPLDQAWLDGHHDELFQRPAQPPRSGSGVSPPRSSLASLAAGTATRPAAAPTAAARRRDEDSSYHGIYPYSGGGPDAPHHHSTPSSGGWDSSGTESSNNSYSSSSSDGGGGGGGDGGGGGSGE